MIRNRISPGTRFLALSIISFVCVATRLHGALIYDDFSGSNAVNLAGTTPDQTINGEAWVGNTLFKADGSVSIGTNANTQVAINLGAGYFSTNPGVYSMSLDVTLPVGSTATNWVGIGFTNSTAPNSNLAPTNSTGGNPWMMIRANGEVNVYSGQGVGNRDFQSTVPYTGTQTLRLELDTTSTAWRYNAYVGNAQLDLNGADAGMTRVFGTNPNPTYLVLATAYNAGQPTTVFTVDNFRFEAVPEPGSTLLALFGIAALVGCRRRL